MLYGPIELNRAEPSSSSSSASLAISLPRIVLHQPQMCASLLLLLFAALGLLVSPLWFSLHLLDLLGRSANLQYVARSITTHGGAILVTAAFGAIVVYIYAVAGFGLLPSTAFAALPSSNGDDEGEYCGNLAFCWMEALNQGLRGGDIGVLMHEAGAHGDSSWSDYLSVVAYQLSFYCLIVVLLLSVVLGIVVDTFSQLRAEEHEKRRHMNAECFICGIDRATLDAQADGSVGGGFESHIRCEHNMWSYIFLLVHLKEKEPLQCNGWEHYVLRKLEKQDHSFLPSALSYRDSETHASAREDSNDERLAAMEASLSGALHHMAVLADRSERTEKLLERLSRVHTDSTAGSSQRSTGLQSQRSAGTAFYSRAKSERRKASNSK